MKVIAFVSQKGGTSKTTTAINLAVEAVAHGLEALVIDLDPQVSACDWADIRGDKPPVVAATPVPHLERTLKTAREHGAELVIIDTAGRTNDAAAAAVRVADLVYVPVQPSLVDLKTLSATMDIVRLSSAGKKVESRVVLTRVKAVGSRHEDTARWLAENDNPICPVIIGERVVYQDAYAVGLGVSEAEPGGKAAHEIRELYRYTSRIVGLPERRIS